MTQKTLKWTAAQPIKKSDNIISSKARETGNTGFVPSYLSEPKENMRYIMSNEYMRMWFKERGKFEKDAYTRIQIIKEESKIKRRFVQRMMTYQKPTKNRFIDDQCQKIPKQQATKEQNVDYSKLKYKPCCPKQKEQGIIAKATAPTSAKREQIKTVPSTKSRHLAGDSKKETQRSADPPAPEESPKQKSTLNIPSLADPCCCYPPGSKESPKKVVEEKTQSSCCCHLPPPKESPKQETRENGKKSADLCCCDLLGPKESPKKLVGSCCCHSLSPKEEEQNTKNSTDPFCCCPLH